MNRNIIVAFTAFLAGILACSMPEGTPPTPVVVTHVVVLPNEGEPTQPPAPPPSSPSIPLPTITAQPVDTATSTVTATITATATATLSGPTATFIKNANCRNGPGTKYEVVTSYFAGQTVQIVGRNPDFDNTWWLIKMPTGGKCWVSLTTAEASGDFDAIPTVIP